jgi:hypothetical protein
MSRTADVIIVILVAVCTVGRLVHQSRGILWRRHR